MYSIMTQEIASFLFRRFCLALLTVFVVATATFFLMKSVPGDPFAEEMQTATAQSITALKRFHGLDDPLSDQYIRYIKQIATLNFGSSLKSPSQTVNQIIQGGFPISATIGIAALFIALPIGMLLGSLAAIAKTTVGKWLSFSSTIFGVSVPNFVIAASLQFLFAIYFPIFPVARWGTVSQAVLPTLALAIGPSCFIARLLRANILEISMSQYVQTARLKGLSEFRIMTVHVWKNASLPIITYLGPVITNILVGSFVVEQVFGIPGLGQWLVTGIVNRDYPVIGGLTLFYSILLITVHTAIDIITAFLNPAAKSLSQKASVGGTALVSNSFS